jgi:N-acyl-L-homoserine lactone synthetase
MNQYKIITFSLFDLHKHGDIFEKFCKFRYQGFIIEEKYDLQTYGDADFDTYDNPFARYIAILNKEEEIVACSRVNRTDISYMAKDCWSHLIPKKFLPSDERFYELTRQYSSSKLERIERMKMVRIISAATYFTLLELNATGFCFVSDFVLFRTTEKLGMNPKSVARIDLPNFSNLHFVHVNVSNEDAKTIARNLLEITGFDILEHFALLD